MLSTIPFRFENYAAANEMRRDLVGAEIIRETRGDKIVIIEEDGDFYVVIHTGNLRGMIFDLEQGLFM